MDTSLTGVYPILIDGEAVGDLTVSVDGAFMLFFARTRAIEGLFRLSVYGGGQEGYLGVMKPTDGGMELKKHLSRVSLLDFPKTITHGGPSFQPISPASAENEPPTGENAMEAADAETSPPEECCIPPPADCAPCPNPCSLFSTAQEKSRFGEVRGALAGENDGAVYLYVPEAEARRCGLFGVPHGSLELFVVRNGALE